MALPRSSVWLRDISAPRTDGNEGSSNNPYERLLGESIQEQFGQCYRAQPWQKEVSGRPRTFLDEDEILHNMRHLPTSEDSSLWHMRLLHRETWSPLPMAWNMRRQEKLQILHLLRQHGLCPSCQGNYLRFSPYSRDKMLCQIPRWRILLVTPNYLNGHPRILHHSGILRLLALRFSSNAFVQEWDY